ncbi:hypothetical protein [Mesorhizobium sp. ORM16]|uniref:hypothetical protein n=1 Tax=Mesorhizobium sp. ORM16 TaxID=3376989 RepID=UPI003857ECCD
MNAIQIAYAGRCDMIGTVLKAVYGGGDETIEVVESSPIMTEEMFDAMFVRG